MSQHDQIINNAPGATVLIDLNAAFDAIFSSSSGPIEPLVKQAGQLWFDTATATLNIRNAANSGWMQFTLGFNPTDTYTKAQADAAFAQILTTYTKAQADARFAQTANTYTKAEVDAALVMPLKDTVFAATADATKRGHFDLSAITAGQDRAIRVPDKASLAFGGWELIADDEFSSPILEAVYPNLAAFHALTIVYDGAPVSAPMAPIMRFSADNGATWITATTYYYVMLYNYSSFPTITQGAGSSAYNYLAAGTCTNATGHGVNFTGKFWGFNKPRWLNGLCKLGYHTTTSGIANMSMGQGLKTLDVLNALKIFSLDGTSTFNGHITIHGLRG